MENALSMFTLSSTSHTQDGETSDASIVEAAKADLAAFELLYNRYMIRVYRYLRVRISSDEDAADLTQQVFLKVLDALPRYRSRGVPFAAWLFRIARNVATDSYRRHKSTVSWDMIPTAVPLPHERDPETAMLQQEALTRLRGLVDKLDAYKRELLQLRFAAGLSTSEIALVVGKSQAAVKKQLTRILQTLKEQYHEA